MTTEPISLRLDDEARHALVVIQNRDGSNRSDAIRSALIAEAKRARRRAAIEAEAALARDDADDVAQMRAVAEFMEDLREPW